MKAKLQKYLSAGLCIITLMGSNVFPQVVSANGSNPSSTSPIYRKPITASATTAVKAYAAATGMLDSAIASAGYTIGTEQLITPSTLKHDMNNSYNSTVTIQAGETLADIKAGTTSLKKDTDYTVSGNIVTVGGYLNYIFGKWPSGPCSLTLCMVSGKTATLIATKMPDSITPSTAQFDMGNPENLSITIQGQTLKDIKAGTTSLTKGIDYKISNGIAVISKGYLSTYFTNAHQDCSLTFEFNGGGSKTLTVTAKEACTSLITPSTLQHDMNRFENSTVTIQAGETLKDIKAGTVLLKCGTDYTVSGNVVTVGGYLNYIFSKWPNVICSLTFYMASGKTAAFTATKMPDSITTSTVQFDMGNPANLSIPIQGQTLSDVKSGTTSLTKCIDYRISSGIAVISKNYLTTYFNSANSDCMLTFVFSSGARKNFIVKPVYHDSVLSQTTATFEKSAPADISVTMELNGNKLSTIKNGTDLIQGIDYVVSGNMVTLKADYLNKQKIGDTVLNFAFINGNPQVLTVNIKNSSNLITPSAVQFDMGNPANLSIPIQGQTLSDVKSGTTSLTKCIDYKISNDIAVISKGYLTTYFNSVNSDCTLIFVFSSGARKNFIVKPVYQDSVLSQTTATFEKSVPADISVTMTLNGNKLSSIKNGTDLIQGIDYVVSGNMVTLKADYLSKQKIGTTVLNFAFSDGNPQALTVNIKNSSNLITPSAVQFCINSPVDISIIIQSGQTLLDIKSDTALLKKDTDYTIVNNVVTISKSFLSGSLANMHQDCIFTFIFSDGSSKALTVTPVYYSSISPTTVAFDKNMPRDLNIKMALNGNMLMAIKNGSTVLRSGIDYTVSNTTVTLKTSYLNNLPSSNGIVAIKFVFSAGIEKSLGIKVIELVSDSSVAPCAVTFNTLAPEDIPVTMTLNGNTFTSIKSGEKILSPGIEYTVSGNDVILKSDYLKNLPLGNTILDFIFSTGKSTRLTVTTVCLSPVPGKIESENYMSMSGVQIQDTTDVGGGKEVASIDAGDWVDYQVYAKSAGKYNIEVRFKNTVDKSQLQIKDQSGKVLASTSELGINNWSSTICTIDIPAGSQTLRFYVLKGTFSLNWIDSKQAEPDDYDSNLYVPIKINTEITGKISFQGDCDTFTFTPPVDGTYYMEGNSSVRGIAGSVWYSKLDGTYEDFSSNEGTGIWQDGSWTATLSLKAGKTYRIDVESVFVKKVVGTYSFKISPK